MPSGKTHDAVTFLLAAPTFAAAYLLTLRPSTACLVTAGFLFGGLMFGPDLDTVSRQYSRWSIFRFIWMPYRALFRHRSRFSHGLIFGSLLRVIYFHAVIALLVFLATYLWSAYAGGVVPGWNDLVRSWQRLGNAAYSIFGESFLLLTFIGIWLGAASHTFTDIAGSYIKTGRVAGPF